MIKSTAGMAKFAHAILVGAVFLCLPLVVSTAVHAATLTFDPSSAQVKVGETTSLSIKVNAGTSEVLGVDALIEYDKTLLKVESITEGTYLTITTRDSATEGKAYIAGAVESAGESVTGSGVFATIKFKALANGTSSVKFLCELGETGESNISESSIDATDLIECSQNGQATIVSSGGTTTGGTTGTTGGRTSTSSAGRSSTQLPQTGVVQDMVVMAMFVGGALFLVGIGTRLLGGASGV